MTIAQRPVPKPPMQLGSSLPPGDVHGVSVYIPTWKDTLAWAQRDPKLLKQLKTGYPRFFVPLVVRELANRLIELVDDSTREVGDANEPAQQEALIFPAEAFAKQGQTYLQSHNKGPVQLYDIKFDGQHRLIPEPEPASRECDQKSLYLVKYSKELAPEAKAFWQHTGLGVSSRCASYWLENSPGLHENGSREGRLPKRAWEFSLAWERLVQRIAGLYSTEDVPVERNDVLIYHTGMSAISHVASAIGALRPRIFPGDDGVVQVAVFGFLYVDTFKVLSKIHKFECVLYGSSATADLDQLEQDLKSGMRIQALFTEFPGNPLLGSVDLDRLHQLAEAYQFMVVVDDTVGTSVNTNLLSSCDVVCTSLTKMFSGACNAMGGSIVVNPDSAYFEQMQKMLAEQYIDAYYPLDFQVMEQNSRDFKARVLKASYNAEKMADMLRKHPSVAQVFYPKGSPTQDVYDRYRRTGRGYGYLLSIRFSQPSAAIVFHDALDVAKGPSLGTNFTLCCAYTLYAHYSELEWAAKFGVVEDLVRVSVGIEDWEVLEGVVQRALDAAERETVASGYSRVAK